MKQGDKVYIQGLKTRTDLNGQRVELLAWKRKLGRWEVRCEKNGECVRVKYDNLTTAAPLDRATLAEKRYFEFRMDTVMADTLKQMVCGNNEMLSRIRRDTPVEAGQISRMVFEPYISVSTKAYGEPPAGLQKEKLSLCMFLDHVGKSGDAELIYISFKEKLLEEFPSFHAIPHPPAIAMDTAARLTSVMMQARKGTLAHLESQQSLIKLCKRNGPGGNVTIQSDRSNPTRAVANLLSGRDGNKSLKRTTMMHELIRAAMGGEVLIGLGTAKSIQVSELVHRAYVGWLINDVLPTLDPSDAIKGSLSKWHQIQAWERQLTSSIEVSPDLTILDVSDSFSINSWIDGFVSFNLDRLLDMPGVDVDRRIVRFVFFANLAERAVMNRMGQPADEDQQSSETSLCAGEAAALGSAQVGGDSPAFAAGTKVEVVNLVVTPAASDCDDNGVTAAVADLSDVLANGMEGRIVTDADDDASDSFLVKFANLDQPVSLPARNLRVREKVERDKHSCAVCGKEDVKEKCSRCRQEWYCGEECQQAHYKQHKTVCKALVSQYGGLSRLLGDDKASKKVN